MPKMIVVVLHNIAYYYFYVVYGYLCFQVIFYAHFVFDYGFNCFQTQQ